MTFLKREFNLFLLALGFFSRIPMPAGVDYSSENLNRASRYFTLVGWFLGAIVALVFCTSNLVFSKDVSLWLAMGFSLLLTGAFHEDGLADTADGFGGGFTREKKLSIMKDSRIGTYGAAALVFGLSGKYILLIDNNQIALSLLIAYALSRATAASLLFDMTYVADIDNSKSKPLANNHSIVDLSILTISAIPVFILLPPLHAVVICASLFIYRQLAKWFFNRQIGGYTGDCLGAAQQVGELLIYLLFLLLLAI